MHIERLKVNLSFGLEDSEFESYSYDIKSDRLVIQIRLWNANLVKFSFYEVIHFVDKANYGTDSFCEVISEVPLLQEAIKNYYEKVPEKHHFKVYEFLNLDDEPSFEIISSRYELELIPYKS
jgi:hypothetical protein